LNEEALQKVVNTDRLFTVVVSANFCVVIQHKTLTLCFNVSSTT